MQLIPLKFTPQHDGTSKNAECHGKKVLIYTIINYINNSNFKTHIIVNRGNIHLTLHKKIKCTFFIEIYTIKTPTSRCNCDSFKSRYFITSFTTITRNMIQFLIIQINSECCFYGNAKSNQSYGLHL